MVALPCLQNLAHDNHGRIDTRYQFLIAPGGSHSAALQAFATAVQAQARTAKNLRLNSLRLYLEGGAPRTGSARDT